VWTLKPLYEVDYLVIAGVYLKTQHSYQAGKGYMDTGLAEAYNLVQTIKAQQSQSADFG